MLLWSTVDPARTRALNSLLIVVKFSLSVLAMDRDDERWLWLPRLVGGGGGGRRGGVKAWISLISVICSSSWFSSDIWLVEVFRLLFNMCTISIVRRESLL